MLSTFQSIIFDWRKCTEVIKFCCWSILATIISMLVLHQNNSNEQNESIFLFESEKYWRERNDLTIKKITPIRQECCHSYFIRVHLIFNALVWRTCHCCQSSNQRTIICRYRWEKRSHPFVHPNLRRKITMIIIFHEFVFPFCSKTMMTDLLVNNSRGGTWCWTLFSTDSRLIINTRRSFECSWKRDRCRKLTTEPVKYVHSCTEEFKSNKCVCLCAELWMTLDGWLEFLTKIWELRFWINTNFLLLLYENYPILNAR